MEEKAFIPIVKAREAAKIFIKDILYIESDGRKIALKTSEEEYCMYAKIIDIEKFLDLRFYRCHSRCIINLEKVIHMKNQYIIFEGGEQIYISRQKFTDTIRFYKGYLLKKKE